MYPKLGADLESKSILSLSTKQTGLYYQFNGLIEFSP